MHSRNTRVSRAVLIVLTAAAFGSITWVSPNASVFTAAHAAPPRRLPGTSAVTKAFIPITSLQVWNGREGESSAFGSRAFMSPDRLRWRFRWATGVSGAAAGLWQVSRRPFGSSSTAGNVLTPRLSPTGRTQLLRARPRLVPRTPGTTGRLASAPPRGRFAEFEIDFARFAPNPPDPDPTTYYVRVVALDSRGNWVGQPSPSIMLSYGTPRVIRMPGSRIQLMPRPLSVTVELENFRVHNADEDGFLSNGDEPYLFVVAVFADGATIRIDDLVHSTVRLASCTRAHDNLNANHVDAGYSGPVPAATGSFTASMLPIDDGGLGIGGALARAAVVVVAMEEDGTSNSAARAGLRAFVDTLQTELNRAVQRSLGRVNEDAVQERVESAVREAIKDETLTWNVFNLLSGVVDPDDYIGAAFIQWSLTDIAAAGSEGIPIEMHLRKSGVHYEITGRVTGR